MKKIINNPNDVVTDSLRGLALAHPDMVEVDLDQHIVYRKDPKKDRVAIISGGGSGHEPLHSGFVGTGMLDAAVCGEVFTSPVPDQIMEATNKVDAGKGVLHIVKNYTGDVMNFEMAAEMAADMENTQVASVIVADDVAVQDSLYTAGRRGVGGTVFVEKIAGAYAEEGHDLAAVAEVAQRVADNTRSFGLALTSCTVPAAGKPTFELAENEIELGIGIHGEPGRERRELQSARELAGEIVRPILADLDFTGAPVVALLGGMGATPLSELYLIWGECAALLDEAGVKVERVLVGDYVTSLEMAGCALSLLKADAELLRLWDAPVVTTGLRWGA
ncbi:dihydroxyacetone kinase subunit DhaK [Trueperella bialowiezensis]|uniref:PTS-dependent dihydroxyacetone kinase, dihydroxyacetone-binding subunit dhaK n=1 Tax=Trueperella bialowiezensis TaxID=312285 RepID=A0A3S4VU01_9ACTO|nr:dihydroxyacetone kinase subunit DhaK [Trueperella bialowiezensis]VEI13662.1 PTS-dependent dihydroxyacetone kinase, dihydroxyacetone-binding subunit dhaK [Trueperella bialowiezensis]